MSKEIRRNGKICVPRNVNVIIKIKNSVARLSSTLGTTRETMN